MQGNLNLANNKITNLAAGTGAGDAATWAQLFGASTQADIASAATTDIGVQNTSFLRVTGTTTITSFGTSYRGPRFLTFEGAVTLTHSSTLVLPGNANITTAAGDSLIVIPGATLGTADKWVVMAYQKNQNPASSTFTSVTTNSLTVNGNNISATNSLGFRNRIINGDMRIDQRNAGASVTYPGTGSAGANLYILDRWVCNSTGSTRFSIQRSTTAPAGFSNGALITTTTAGTPGDSDACYFGQYLEGFNVSDLGFGTSNAQSVSISFWVRSSLTGLFGGTLANTDFSRRYAFGFTINLANTWEYKTVVIPGDTSGTWATDNSRCFSFLFNLGGGSSSKGTAGSWGNTVTYPTGSVDLVATAGATLNITGVQLEAGSVVTPFERRPYGTELALCQRYYESISMWVLGGSLSPYMFSTKKRASPTVSSSAAGFNLSSITPSVDGFWASRTVAGQTTINADIEL
jgi:hypothetical protein